MLCGFPCSSVIPDLIVEGHFGPDYHGVSQYHELGP